MKKSRKTVCIFAAGAAAAAVMITGTMAYLTDYDTVTNEFTVGKVDIDVTEPTWDPEENDDLLPTQEIDKDPQITNSGINEAYVYLEVSVPIRSLITADASGNRIDEAPIELFSFQADENWTLMDSYEKDSNQIYIYSYNEILPPAETTTALFEKMTFANVVEGQIDGQTFEIPVRGYAIQTTNTGGDGESIPEQAKNAFEAYINQNAGYEGEVTTV